MAQARPKTLTALLSATAASVPDRVAISAPGAASVTYSELCGHVARVGSALRAAGVDRGNRVGTVLPNGLEAALAFLGVASHAICAPLNPASTVTELERSVADLRLDLLVTDAGLDSQAAGVARRLGLGVIDLSELAEIEPAADVPADAAPAEDVALLLATSGTTSRPKLVPLTHANLCASARNVATELRLTVDDRCLNPMPLFHIHGLVAGLLASLGAGATVICTRGFDASRMLDWLDQQRPTWYTAVPTMHQALLAAVERTLDPRLESSLRLIRSSSSPLPRAVLLDLERVFQVPVIESYGMTEAAHQIASNPLPPAVRKPGTVGCAAGPEVAIVDGEIVIRGANVTTGYLDDPVANEGAFTNHGWFRTGDEGVLDNDGYLTIRGRLKEIINRGGEKVSPREVDEALTLHPDVGQAAAFAIPHPTLGEEIAAAVVLRSGVKTTVRELRAFAATRLGPSKVPRRIVLLDDLPRGPTGKVQRLGLAEALRLDTVPAPGRAARTPLEAALAGIWAQLLGLEQVGIDQDFFLLGGDSLLGAELLAAVGDTFGVEVPLEALVGEAATVADMAALLERPRAGTSVPTARGEALSRRLFQVQAGGSRPPLFCIEPSLALMHHLVPRLGPDQPVLGLLMAPVDENPAAFERIESIAEYHLTTLREAQPSGPYFLAGHSFVGIVAFEMAHQLRLHGETVGLLVLLDTISPTSRWKSETLDSESRSPGDHGILASRYTPGKLDAPTALLYTRGSADEAGVPTLGWGGFVTGRLELHEVGGDHSTMLQEPRVLALSEMLASCLEAAQARL